MAVLTDDADALVVRPFRAADQDAVIALWVACDLVRPWNDPVRDIARKAAVQPELFLVGVVGGCIVASAMVGYDGHRGWINYLAVDPTCRRRGHARALIDTAERLLVERGCPKLNLQVRAGNDAVVAFYAALGYRHDGSITLGKRLIPDD